MARRPLRSAGLAPFGGSQASLDQGNLRQVRQIRSQPFKDDSFLPGKLPSFDPSSLPKEGPVYTPGTFEEKLNGKSETKERPLGESLLKDKPIEGEQPVKDENKADEKKSEEAAPAGTDQARPRTGQTGRRRETGGTTPEETPPEAK